MVNRLFRINSAIGIGLTIHPDGSTSFNVCQIIRQNNRLDFEKKAAGLNSLEELKKEVQNTCAVSFNVSGRGILHKEVEKLEEITPAHFSQLLPNANFEDFYIQNFISGERSFISVIRKTEADKWIAELKKVGYNVVMLSMGPFPVDRILPQLNFYDNELVFDGHVIQKGEQKQWINYHYETSPPLSFPLKIESEKIDQRLIIAYASAFQLVMASQVEPVQAIVSNLEKSYEHILSIQWIKAYSALVLAAIFLLLVVNFILFSWMGSNNSKMTYQVSRSTQSSHDIKGIADEITQKEKKLKKLGWNGGIKPAYQIDQIASDMPGEITWKEIAVNPIDVSASQVQKALSFKDGQIKVTGYSEQIIPVNEWIARIKIKKRVKQVQLENYNFNTELNTGQFTLIITY